MPCACHTVCPEENTGITVIGAPSISGSAHERAIDDIFSLVQLHQVLSRECEHVSERCEVDYALSLEVRNRRTVRESLDFFIEGDRLEGDNKYQCEPCGNRKVAALKRTCLKVRCARRAKNKNKTMASVSFALLRPPHSYSACLVNCWCMPSASSLTWKR